jgi:hypothetical protein
MNANFDPDFEDDEVDDDYGAQDDDEPMEPCPHCGEEIYEDAQRCPHCGQYVSQEDSPRRPKPWWIVIGAILGLYAVFRWIHG